MNSSPNPPTTVVALLHELRDETSTLLKQELALAKAELKENATRAGQHALRIALGGFVLYAGAIVLLIGLGQLLGMFLVRAGLEPDLAQWLAPSLVGLVVAIIGYSMLAKAKRGIADETLKTRRTIENLKTNLPSALT